MTDEQIIKALEYCSRSDVGECGECPFFEKCENDELLVTYTLDIIKRQKEMIRALINAQETLWKAIGEKDKEIERLKSGHILYGSEE